MLKHDTTPIDYGRTLRPDVGVRQTSGRAGEVIPVAFFPHFRGDTASGRINVSVSAREMPKPLLNAIMARVQVWCVPRPAFPQFSGVEDYIHSWNGENISALGAADRTPTALYSTVGAGAIASAQSSEFFRATGHYLVSSTEINTDYNDAYNLVYNFRLAAHSNKMDRVDYYSEDATAALELKPAFWPRSDFSSIVADYEDALVRGAMELDVSAGRIPVSGIGVDAVHSAVFTGDDTRDTVNTSATNYPYYRTSTQSLHLRAVSSLSGSAPDVVAEMEGQTVTTTLAGLDKARTTNAFAKRVSAMNGSDYDGFTKDDVVMAEFIQGFAVPNELLSRPWLIDSQTQVLKPVERHATDAANLDDSVTISGGVFSLAYNVPETQYGAVGMVTVECMPERLFTRATDEYLYCTERDHLPNAPRDVQREIPVDIVRNRRLDAAHTTPSGIYGYEPMNNKWRREMMMLGGEYRQMTPGTPSDVGRHAVWQPDYVDPVYTEDHFLCPHPFPQDVFAVPGGDVFDITVNPEITFLGITQFGDTLTEDNGDFARVKEFDTLD